jgi:AraC-like DNA-binding protein
VIDPAARNLFNITAVADLRALDNTLRVTQSSLPRGATPRNVWKYRLQDRTLLREQCERPVFSIAARHVGSILTTYVESRFATENSVDGDKGDLLCFVTPLHGKITMVQNGDATTATASSSLVWRVGPGTVIQMSDNNARSNVFLKMVEIEEALERTLDEHLTRPLEFGLAPDWNRGLAASLKRQLNFVMEEFQQADGVTSNAVAMASMTDHLLSLVLRGAPHNYSDRIDRGLAGAVPAYIRRAEDFMRAHCAEPIRMAQVAEAAGCSVGTLGVSFRNFRARTTLGALHAIRLERAYEEITRAETGASVATIARRYGFTNVGRFTVAFRRRFAKTPSEVARRTSRS